MAEPQTAYDFYKQMMGFKSDAEAAAYKRKLTRKSLIATNLPVSELQQRPLLVTAWAEAPTAAGEGALRRRRRDRQTRHR